MSTSWHFLVKNNSILTIKNHSHAFGLHLDSQRKKIYYVSSQSIVVGHWKTTELITCHDAGIVMMTQYCKTKEQRSSFPWPSSLQLINITIIRLLIQLLLLLLSSSSKRMYAIL